MYVYIYTHISAPSCIRAQRPKNQDVSSDSSFGASKMNTLVFRFAPGAKVFLLIAFLRRAFVLQAPVSCSYEPSLCPPSRVCDLRHPRISDFRQNQFQLY